MLDELMPQVLYSPMSLAHVGQCDCDCACVVDVPAVTARQMQGDTWVRESPIHAYPLTGPWRATYNPAGPVGVAALSSAAEELLSHFAEPARLDEMRLSLPGVPPAAVDEAMHALIQVGLLRAADAAPVHALQAATLSAWLHVAEACNLHCPYCYVPRRPRLASVETGQLAVDRLVDLAGRHGYSALQLKYAGGEPTLNFPVVWAVHRYAARRTAAAGLGLKEVLLTNGVDLSDWVLDAVAEAGMKLMVSLDGGPESHNETRRRPGGTSSYDLVVSTVDRAIARGLHVDISITLTALNLHGVPEAVAFAVGRQLPFSLNFYRECRTSRKLAQAVLSHLRPDPDKMIDVVRRAMAIVEAEPAYPLPLTGILDRARLDVPHGRPCSAGRDYLAVDPDGRVAACQMLLEDPWADLSDEDPLLAIRGRGRDVFRPVHEFAECSCCEWQAACSGGCPLLRDTPLHRSYCRVYKTLLPDLIRLEGKRLIELGRFQ